MKLLMELSASLFFPPGQNFNTASLVAWRYMERKKSGVNTASFWDSLDGKKILLFGELRWK